MHADPADTIALFRFRVIAEATNPRLSATDRGQIAIQSEGSEVEFRKLALTPATTLSP